jgi:hypothetical protein
MNAVLLSGLILVFNTDHTCWSYYCFDTFFLVMNVRRSPLPLTRLAGIFRSPKDATHQSRDKGFLSLGQATELRLPLPPPKFLNFCINCINSAPLYVLRLGRVPHPCYGSATHSGSGTGLLGFKCCHQL